MHSSRVHRVAATEVGDVIPGKASLPGMRVEVLD
jgi:hypothetical protein